MEDAEMAVVDLSNSSRCNSSSSMEGDDLIHSNNNRQQRSSCLFSAADSQLKPNYQNHHMQHIANSYLPFAHHLAPATGAEPLKNCAQQPTASSSILSPDCAQNSQAHTSSSSNGTTGTKNKKLFPQKLWDLINDERYDFCLRWSDDGQLVYLNRDEFEDSYLKTAENQFHTQKAISFVRQMNMYGFRKVDDCYYENDNFKRGCEHLLKNMTRKHPNKGLPTAPAGTSAAAAAAAAALASSAQMDLSKQQMPATLEELQLMQETIGKEYEQYLNLSSDNFQLSNATIATPEQRQQAEAAALMAPLMNPAAFKHSDDGEAREQVKNICEIFRVILLLRMQMMR